ncbi:DNA (cytosine-5-)-methyltransferase [Candidatus Nomurabacteria bacterium]|nr:DNA (cytosine-5-)-methyltransferase [Candidatus Nomurabacteria bacterium]
MNRTLNNAKNAPSVLPHFSSVLSLFDGISCGQIALNRVGIKYDNYFASEIDKHAIKVTMKNYPKTMQLGDVIKVKGWDLPKIDLLIGGSPCQGFSFAGKGLNFEDPRSKLFFEFVRLKSETQPKYWMLENVKMKTEHQNIISEILGVKPILINSELVSAQRRERLYWTNIPITELPTDKGILLKDIIEIGEPIKDKSQTILATLYKENAKSMIKRNKAGLLVKMSSENPQIKELSITDRGKRPHRNDKRKSGISEIGTIHYPDTKSYTITANHAPKVSTEIIGWRKLTPKECERLQTVPDNYTDCVSDSQRYKMLGNGWTVDVIAHIFNGLLNENL